MHSNAWYWGYKVIPLTISAPKVTQTPSLSHLALIALLISYIELPIPFLFCRIILAM